MKLPALVTALALACGTATAAGSSYSDRDTSTTTRQPSATVSNDTQHKEGFIDKTKRAFHRLGEKMRSATHRNSTQEAKKDDTRSMGAPR